jgi:arylsulfatase A-like enzyme/lysophospholipase L1-like esterase
MNKAAFLICTTLSLMPVATIQAAGKPNIIFFLVDDMGWQETSVPFHSEITALNRRYRTPNMERLAAQGMMFTQAYASAVCSPTRVSALTGMNVARHRVTNWTLRKDRSPDNPSKLIQPPDWNLNGICIDAGIARTMQVTPLPMLLREAGYRTIHVGKAHFGAKDTPGENPLHLGFDVNIAGHCAGGPGSYWGEKNFSAAWRTNPPDLIWDVPGLDAYHGKNIYLTEALTREAIKAVESAVADRQPFYLYMSHYAVHAPWEKDDRFYQKYMDVGLTPFEATLASMIEGMDKSLGDLMATLDRLGVADNTIILFMSDNGSPTQCPPNLPLRGHKLTPYEGGIREPMIVKWPGVTKPASVCRDPVVIEDFFPTILEIADADWRGKTLQTVDGVSFVPLLKGEGKTPADRAFVWHFPHNYGGQGPFSAIRQGPWKLIYHHTDRRVELFNIEEDISETHDLANENRAKAGELAKRLTEGLLAESALMPVDKATGKPIELPAEAIATPPVVRVACLGDSITFGAGVIAREQNSYPAQLAALLGDRYDVRNFGVGSATLLADGDKPYGKSPQFQAAIQFDPDIVLLLLGANDTCGAPRNNWDRSASFVSDARRLLQSLHRPGRRVLVALPAPMLPDTPGLKPARKADLEARRPRLEQIRTWWREAAQAEAAEVVDLAGTLAPEPELVSDGVHPTSAGYGRIAARFHDAILGRPSPDLKEEPIPSSSQRSELRVPESSLARALVWQGIAIEDPDFTIWGASPLVADGKFHLFAARWPEANVDPAWRRSSEIAHYVSDRPQGPFHFQRVVVRGTGRTGEWDAFAPHNPEIRRFGNTFALCYIANSDFHQPPHPLNQKIGMLVSDSINGPWKKVGQEGLILGPSPDPNHFSHGKQVVNPALLKVADRFHLYFKTGGKVRGTTLYGLAVADQLTGPYRMLDEPITGDGVFIEDASAFLWEQKVCLLTTDNHGRVTGLRGGGALWVSDDGIHFKPEWTQLGFALIPRYYAAYNPLAVKKIYGSDPKFERPKVLCLNGRPAWLYAPSGWNITGGQRTVDHVLKVNLQPGDGPVSGMQPQRPFFESQ